MAVEDVPVSFTEGNAKDAGVKNRLEEGADGELGELYFVVWRDV